MIRRLSAFLAGALLCSLAFGQSVPNGTITQGQIWTVSQWNNAFQLKADVTNGTLTSPTINGGTLSGSTLSNPTITGGALTTPTINGVAVNTPIPTFPRTAAEIAAGVTPSNFIYPVINALRYGCDPTGATSSQTCINTITTYLNAVGGGTIYFPSGTYATPGNSFTNGQVLIKGDGPSATFFLNSSANTPTLTFGDGVNARFGGGIEGVGFSGKSGVTGVTGQVGFFFQKIGQFHVDNVNVNNVAPGGAALYRGAVFSAASQFFVRNLQVQASTLDGVTLIGTTDSIVHASRSDANGGDGWAFNNAQGANFVSVTAFNNSGTAWGFISTSPSTAPNFNNKFAHIVGDTSGSYNIQISDCINCYFVDAWASTQQSTSVNTFATGIIIGSQYSKGITFTGGQALNNNSHGVQIFDTGSSAPTKITFDNFQFGSTANGANGNGQASGGGYGLTMNGNVNSVRVIGGIFDGNATGSFQNQSALSDITVCGNPIGFVSTNQGAGVVTTSASSVVITHGLGFTPNQANIQITDISSKAASGISSAWVSATSATTFTVTTDVAVSGFSYNFVWRASYNGC